jgi:acetolactate synthase-1/2/3 large subunit
MFVNPLAVAVNDADGFNDNITLLSIEPVSSNIFLVMCKELVGVNAIVGKYMFVSTFINFVYVDKFLKGTEIPVVSSLMGLDSVSHHYKNYLGFIGSYGNRWANKALAGCDLLIVIGSRLDVRQTGNSVENFKMNKKIVRVDIDKYELNGRIKADLKFQMSIYKFLLKINSVELQIKPNPLIDKVQILKNQFPQAKENPSSVDFNPNLIMDKISSVFSYTNGYVVDVGQHQMWAAQSIHLSDHQRFLTSGGLGSMGFALPAAIGASTSVPGRWIVVMGDGCAQLVSAELETVVQNNLDIVICVFNNFQHGMVSQFQDENILPPTRKKYTISRFRSSEAFINLSTGKQDCQLSFCKSVPKT